MSGVDMAHVEISATELPAVLAALAAMPTVLRVTRMDTDVPQEITPVILPVQAAFVLAGRGWTGQD